MNKQRKYTNAEAKELLESVAGVLVRAREIQHLCWEMQPDLLRVGKNNENHDSLVELEQVLFQTSRKLAKKMASVYNSLPEYIKKENRLEGFSSYVSPARYVEIMYDNISNFGDFDEASVEQIEEMYKKLASETLDESEEASSEDW